MGLVRITDQPIEPQFSEFRASIKSDGTHGALVQFEGIVRSKNAGRDVIAIEYHCYVEMAERELSSIIHEAKEKFSILDAVVVHRIGKVTVGEASVFILTSAVHRDNAFKATSYIIEEIKARVPIWKKEQYVNGEAMWI